MLLECESCRSRYDVSGREPGTRLRCRCGVELVVVCAGSEAATVRCPGCGAPAGADDARCRYCATELATVPCPRCFARMFSSAKHCGHCGTSLERGTLRSTEPTEHPCPRCRGAHTLHVESVAGFVFERCPACHGLWIEKQALKDMIEQRRAPSTDALLGVGGPAPGPIEAPVSTAGYVACPECGRMMNRTNFARRSGVILDVCKAHGTWFDAAELSRVLSFAREGGIEDAQRREAERRIDEARRAELDAKLERQRASAASLSYGNEQRGTGVDLGDIVEAVWVFGRAFFDD